MSAAAATTRMLLRTDDVSIGEFVCPPDDWRWRAENDIGDGFHVVFPWTPVHIARQAMPGLVATPNHAVLYRPRLRFHRRHLCGQGDHCLFAIVAPALCDDPRLDGERLPDPVLTPAVWLSQRLLATYLALPRHDRAIAGDLARALVVATLRAPPAASSSAGGGAVEQTKELMAISTGGPVPLAQVAREAHYSPFHLLRTFHARTGYTLHQYHLHLRLRRAVGPVLAGVPLAEIALGLGFRGHSHFTSRFHRAFGEPPSAIRAAAADGQALPRLVRRLLAA